ncbi:methyltransferase domain-containing protein [bacterium]|nr:MAG: methyltransferase domain-containing protein [bacterium]
MLATEKCSREEYFKTQIEASKRKFRFCKVSINCVNRFREIISRCEARKIRGPILCLGTRNGRELDLFRHVLFGNFITRFILKMFEERKYAFSSRLPLLESFGKSDVAKINKKSVVGVELNPDGKRRDVLIGSFDELPKEWDHKFKIVYSNTLDHAYDPHKAAKEWYRVLAVGGYLVIGFPGQEVKTTSLNPCGNVTLEEIMSLFPGELIYFNRFGNCFADAIIRKK